MPVKSNIAKGLDALNAKDVYSMMMQALYLLKDDPKYSTLSELVYTLDKESLLNFLSVFEGLTIKVPKMSELRDVANGLLLYSLANIEELPYDSAVAEVMKPGMDKARLDECYNAICEVADRCNFKR